jgi:sRNA-binding regulator protein Hfq
VGWLGCITLYAEFRALLNSGAYEYALELTYKHAPGSTYEYTLELIYKHALELTYEYAPELRARV